MEQNYVTFGTGEVVIGHNETNYGTHKVTFGTGKVDIES
jgi:hypothetical protein